MTKEAITAIKAALAAGPTPGPWTFHAKGIHPHRYVCGPMVNVEWGEDRFVVAYGVGMNTETNMPFIAACNPSAISSLISSYEAMERRVTGLEEALKPFADEASVYDPPSDDDNYAAWSGDFPIGALRRARSAITPTVEKHNERDR